MPPPAATAKPQSTRLAQGVVFLAGALATYLLLADEPRLFYRVPITLGIVYLVAAAVGGRDGGHWSTACVLCGWGLAVVGLQDWNLDMNAASAYLAGAGLGALVAGGLERVGVSADLLGVAGRSSSPGSSSGSRTTSRGARRRHVRLPPRARRRGEHRARRQRQALT
jgi:hypothetical protein